MSTSAITDIASATMPKSAGVSTRASTSTENSPISRIDHAIAIAIAALRYTLPAGAGGVSSWCGWSNMPAFGEFALVLQHLPYRQIPTVW